MAARDYPQARITIIDTPLLGAGLGTVVRQAIQWALQGLDSTAISANIKEMAARNRTYFLGETLVYLQNGGRIGAAKALLGSLLEVKPLLGLADGEVGVVESQRTFKRSMQCFVERIERECPSSEQAHLNIMHGEVIVQARKLAAELGQMLGFSEIPILDLPSAILVHGGPGVLGVSFYVY